MFHFIVCLMTRERLSFNLKLRNDVFFFMAALVLISVCVGLQLRVIRKYLYCFYGNINISVLRLRMHDAPRTAEMVRCCCFDV